ncbi:MAG: polysulfide reductase NrfD, partial [Planctomycetia bacterium]|nr:polysulfide reductase NrfD [Planctomycetia bacterium]
MDLSRVTDLSVVLPGWHGWIIAYFYLGGIAAGAYGVHSLAGLFGDEDAHRATRAGAYLAFPLVGVCGLILIVDLNRPERFWHMMVQSETFRPMFKWWSPMSAGSWGLSAFAGFSALSFAGALAEDRWPVLGRWSEPAAGLRRGPVGRVVQVGGALASFFLGAYTGTLLSATNQPGWAQTTWLSPLFLASAGSTGVAAILVATPWRPTGSPVGAAHRLERLDAYAILLELAILAAFAVSLGPLAGPAFGRWPGVLIPAFVLPAGLLLPLVMR